ncbi:hypothetical protein BCR34DRAFT_598594 [Clohesyomyces aquaticus]|uniref:Rhodopsin domain-containing protein n=1 Tax=Clohesyomyces aquaticus TaxID=1231657 RepID=A0A1Y1ZXX4_9PLEO|nr:hypothetical protein BCR34DRAFT_598594 [Clohesyomyces aquaticus]
MSNEVIQPPYVIAPDDKRGLIVVMSGMSFSFVWTCFLIRIYLRLKTREWRSDDYFLTAATVFDTIQSALVIHMVNDGLGTLTGTLSDGDLQKIGRDEFASQILYIITLFLSKCAVIFLYLRLSPGKGHAIASWSTLSISGMWALLAIILISVPCDPYKFWTQGALKCTGVYTKWQAIGAIDIIIEVLIFAISIYLVAGLNMRFGSKAMVIGAFSARLPVIAAAGARLIYLSDTLASPNRSLDGSFYIVATQWQLGYAIMSSTITGLGPFLRPFTKSSAASYRRSSYSHHPSETQSQSGASSHQLDVLQARAVSVIHATGRSVGDTTPGDGASSSKTGNPQTANGGLHLRPDEFQRDTAVLGGGDAGMDEEDANSRMSDESRRMMIRKKTDFSVENGRAGDVSQAR